MGSCGCCQRGGAAPAPQDVKIGREGRGRKESMPPDVPLPRMVTSKLGEGRGDLFYGGREGVVSLSAFHFSKNQVLCIALICFPLTGKYS